MMNADEIVRALKCTGNETEHCKSCLYAIQSKDKEMIRRGWWLDFCANEKIQRDAADLIESLQAQLAASQRREQAAVEDMEHIASEIEKCNWVLKKDGEKVASLHLGRCAVCSHKYCGDEYGGGCKFEWRGPQEAGGGEAE